MSASAGDDVCPFRGRRSEFEIGAGTTKSLFQQTFMDNHSSGVKPKPSNFLSIEFDNVTSFYD